MKKLLSVFLAALLALCAVNGDAQTRMDLGTQARYGATNWSSSLATVPGLTATGNVTLGDASGDSLTINAGTWTLGSNYTATRAAGTLATGTVNLKTWVDTFTGDSGGGTSIRAILHQPTTQGANNISTANATRTEIIHSGTGTVTTWRGYQSLATLSSSGNVTTVDLFNAAAPSLSSTGAITTLNGFHIGDLGHATLVTNAVGIKIDNFTASATATRGIQSSINSGTGKHNLYIDGTAENLFAGPVLIADGTANNPSLAFNSDNDGTGTGIYRQAANSIGFSTSGNLRWHIDVNGHFNGGSGRNIIQTTSGNITTAKVNTIENCNSTGGTCSAAPAGSVTIAAAATTVTVSTTAVTANSQIFVQEDSSLGTRLSVTCNTTTGRAYTVTARTAATSFVITADAAPVTNPACLSFFVVN